MLAISCIYRTRIPRRWECKSARGRLLLRWDRINALIVHVYRFSAMISRARVRNCTASFAATYRANLHIEQSKVVTSRSSVIGKAAPLDGIGKGYGSRWRGMMPKESNFATSSAASASWRTREPQEGQNWRGEKGRRSGNGWDIGRTN